MGSGASKELHKLHGVLNEKEHEIVELKKQLQMVSSGKQSEICGPTGTRITGIRPTRIVEEGKKIKLNKNYTNTWIRRNKSSTA